MKYKNMIYLTAGLVSGGLIGWKASSPEVSTEKSNVTVQTPATLSGATASSSNSQSKERVKSSRSALDPRSRNERVDALTNLARTDPTMLKSLNFRLFFPNANGGFTANLENWASLGVSEEEVQTLQEKIAEIEQNTQAAETDFEVLGQADEKVTIMVNPLSTEQADAVKTQIRETFAAVLPDDLATVMGEKFMVDQSSSFATSMGSPVIVTIAAPESENASSPLSFVRRIYHDSVTAEEIKKAEEAGTFRGYRQQITNSVDNIPPRWAHLFEK